MRQQNRSLAPSNYYKNIDIFYKTYRADRQFLLTSLKTVDRFAKGFRKVIIVTDSDDDLTESDVHLTNLPVELFKTNLPPNWGKLERYNHQQFVKINFSQWTDADAILSIDSDTILYDLLTPNMFFSKGKPVWLYDKYDNFLPHQNEPTQKDLLGWRQVIAHVVGIESDKIQYEFMRFPGFLITRRLAQDFTQFIEHKFNKSLFDFFTRPSINESGKHTEYNYLGAFEFYKESTREYEFVNVSDAVKQYSKINGQIPSEIQDNFPTSGRPYPLIQYHSYAQDPTEVSNKMGILTKIYRFEDFIHQPPKKYLLVALYGQTGLGNRIKSVASALTISNISHREPWVIWDINSDMPANFNDLFTNHINLFENYRILGNDLLLLDFPYVLENLDNPNILTNPAPMILLRSWKSFKDVAVDFRRFLPEYIANLRSLRPVSEIQNRVNQFTKTHFKDRRVVGVHFRAWSSEVGDANWNLMVNPIEIFFAAMDSELKQHPNTYFFITTDSQKHKALFADKYKNNIITSDINSIGRQDVSQQLDGLYEWLLLSKTKFIIGTNGSTYSDEAALLTSEQRKIPLGPNPFKGHNPLICFSPTTGQPMQCTAPAP